MGGIGWSELVVVFVLILLLLGSKRVPELARTVGKAKREFDKAKDDLLKAKNALVEDVDFEVHSKKIDKKCVKKDSHIG